MCPVISGGLSVGVPVTVFFCDVVGSGALVDRFGADWPRVVEWYQGVVGRAIEGCGGEVEDNRGTSFFGTFLDAGGAVRAAVEVQRAFVGGVRAADLGADFGVGVDGGDLRVEVCIGMHAGVVGDDVFVSEGGDSRFVGLGVHRGARVMVAANGGQALVTDAVRRLLNGDDAARLEDLGLHRLRDFPESVRLFHLAIDAQHRAAAFPAPKTLDYRPTNLTADDRPLLGRDAMIAQVKTTFLGDKSRLVTLTGPGGVGKTRLAVAIASDLLEEHRGGVWLVRAETLKRADQLLPAIAGVLSVPDVPGRSLLDAVVDRLQAASMLLVLDNLEQLDGVADVVSELVERTVSLRVLATSQTPLRITSESVFAVSVLELDDAIELFSLGAGGVGVALDVDDVAVKQRITSLVERLDRLPLAIELAAAQLRNLTLTELSEGLDAQLELQVKQPDRPQRQQSLHAIIDWSVAALPDQAHRLFIRLGVFTGITTLELMEEICGENINVIEAAATLVDFSLLRRADIGFGMPPAIQQTAAEQLTNSDEKPSLQRRHAETMAKKTEPLRNLNTVSPDAYKEALALEANFSAALAWAHAFDHQLYIGLVLNLAQWFNDSGRVKVALDELSAALVLAPVSDSRRSQLLWLRGHHVATSKTSEREQALSDIEEGLDLVGDSPSVERGNLLLALAIIKLWKSPDQALTTAIEAAEIFRELDRPDRLLRTLNLQASALIHSGNLAAAASILDEATQLASLPSNQDTLYATSMLANIKGDWALAVGKPFEALELFAGAVLRDQDSMFLMFYHAAGVILALERIGRFSEVVELLTALQVVTGELGYNYRSMNNPEVGWPDGILSTAREALSADEFTQQEERGRKIPSGQLATRLLAVANEVQLLATRPTSPWR